MKPRNKDEVREKLVSLVRSLKKNSTFEGDTSSWAADCIQTYLARSEKTLDHAFGLRSSKRGPKPMESGEHDDWVLAALLSVNEVTPEGEEWPDTKVLAKIGRFYGLGGEDNENTEDYAIASELKRILARYKSIAINQLINKIEITDISDETKE